MARRVAVPERVSRMDLIERADYEDAFAAAVPPDVLARCRPERLMEITTARAPRWLMQALVPALHRWVLRLRLDPAAPPVGPPGWRRLGGSQDAVVFGVHGPLFTFRLVLTTSSRELLLATVVRYEHAAARPLWAVVQLGHRAALRYLLALGARLAVADDAAALPR